MITQSPALDGLGESAHRSVHAELLEALRRWDRVLEQAVEAARTIFGPEATGDPFKGLHTSATLVQRLLQRPPADSGFRAAAASDDTADISRANDAGAHADDSCFGWLTAAFGLAPFDVDVLIVALAPELDLRYERIYGFLQNDITRRRPSVELALDLLCPTIADKFAMRARFAPDAPLCRHALIELVADPHDVRPPLLAHSIKLDEQIVRLVLGENTLDPRLASWCERRIAAGSIDELVLSDEQKRSLQSVVKRGRSHQPAAQLFLEGLFAADQRQVAAAVAAENGAPLLTIDLSKIPNDAAGFERILRLFFREARFQNVVLFLENFDALRTDERLSQRHVLLKHLAECSGIVLLSGARPWTATSDVPCRVVTLRLGVPAFAERHRQWSDQLKGLATVVSDAELDTLAARFRLTATQIAQSVVLAQEQSRWRNGARAAGESMRSGAPLTVGDLSAAARSQCRHDVGALTTKIQATYGWADIVLPADTVAQLREICQREANRHRVMDDWGFDDKLSLGKGVNALFAGPSGTGKTMAAEIIANELGLDLYKIDLSGVVSKYIGDTEKNLDRIFTNVENAILFFDEADALFGKRSEVRDSHDRYANLEISYLLQKMEQYDGIAILATNLRQNLDEALVRRLAFTVHFPFPDQAQRRNIWERIWPAALPRAADVDLDFMAAQFKLSGGHIKNVALAAAFLAAADGSAMTMGHLRRATQREYQKLGKTLSMAELAGASDDGAQIDRGR